GGGGRPPRGRGPPGGGGGPVGGGAPADQDVLVTAGDEMVVPAAADQQVAAGAADQLVVAAATDEDVVPLAARHALQAAEGGHVGGDARPQVDVHVGGVGDVAQPRVARTVDGQRRQHGPPAHAHQVATRPGVDGRWVAGGQAGHVEAVAAAAAVDDQGPGEVGGDQAGARAGQGAGAQRVDMGRLAALV